MGPPITTKLGGDDTSIIPNMFLDSGTPTAPPRLDPPRLEYRTVRDRHTKPIQSNFRCKQSILKMLDFLDFQKITTGSAPRMFHSTSFLLAPEAPERRGRRPRGGGIESRGGVPESRNMLGVMLVSPPPSFVAIGGHILGLRICYKKKHHFINNSSYRKNTSLYACGNGLEYSRVFF